MVTDEMVEKAADEMARQDITFANCDRGWQKRTIRAALEAALPAAEPVQTATDAYKPLQRENEIKPVAWVYAADLEKGDGCFGDVKGEVIMGRGGNWVNADTPLYAAPTAVSAQMHPEGWQLVPKEPTQEMLDACGPKPKHWDATPVSRRVRESADRMRREEYKAMLAAAPAKQEGKP